MEKNKTIMSSKLEDEIRDISNMASRIPNFDDTMTKKQLKILPYLNEQEQQNMLDDIRLIIQTKYLQNIISAKNVVLPDIAKDLIDNPITVGNILVGDTLTGACKINLQDLVQSAIIASPGRGKTVFLYNLSNEISHYNKTHNKKISQIILDKRKDFRKLNDAVVLDLQHIPLSLFDPPPNCNKARWVSDVCNLFMSIWQFYQRSRNNLMDIILEMCENLQRSPSLIEIFYRIQQQNINSKHKSRSERKKETDEVIEDRVKNIIWEFEKSVSAKKSFPLHEFLDSNITLVIEADLPNDSFALLFGWILLYVYRYRKDNNLRGTVEDNGTVIICDEAYLLWEVARQFSDLRKDIGADFITTAPLTLRDFRCAIIAASQRPLNQDYMATTNLKVVGYCGDYNDAQYLANCLGDPELTSAILKLDIGKFIIKIGAGKPALLQTELFEETIQTSDEAIQKRMKPFYDYITQYCKVENKSSSTTDENTKDDNRHANQTNNSNKKPHIKLSKDAKQMIIDVAQYPESIISVRYFRLKLKGNRAQNILDEIIHSKYAEIVKTVIDGVKPAKYLVLTQDGINWLRSEQVNVFHLQKIGRTGALHTLYQNILQVYLKKSGHLVRHDYSIGQKFVDVYSEKKNMKTAYEIAISDVVDSSRVVSALHLVDEYVFLCNDHLVVNSIRLQLSHITKQPDNKNKIRLFTANQYIKNLKNSILDYYTENNKNNWNNPEQSILNPDEREEPENKRNGKN